MCRSSSKFYFNVCFFFPGIEMPFTGKEKSILCDSVDLNIVGQDCAASIFERIR